MNRKFLPLFLVLISFACHSPWNNSHSRVAVDCQVNRDESFKRYLRVLNESGEPLSQDRKSSLVAEFLDDAGRYQRPRITPGGCVEIPETDGELAVVESKSKSAVYWKTAATGDAFPSRRLMKRPNFTYESLCQGENRFANTQVKRDWSLTTDGSLQNIRLKVQARNVHDQSVAILYQKNFGDELLLPEAWSTGMLREGQYHLEVFQQDLTDGLETAPRLVSFPALCPLTILHHAPTLLGLAGGEEAIPVVDIDQGLEWKVSRDHADLHVCMEELSSVSRNPTLEPGCQAASLCQNPANFKPMKRIRPEREGVYQIFALAQDYAGNQSAVQCRTAIFSSQAPDFDLRWAREAWNRPAAVLDDAVPILKAQVSGLSHPQLQDDRLNERLECKVDIRLGSTETVTTPRLLCATGRCRGLSLDVYRPCDAEIGIGIQDFWKSPYSQDAVLRLTVRAQDGAGHRREKILPLSIHTSRWQRHSVAWPGEQPLSSVQFWEDAKGNLLTIASDEIYLRSDADWKDARPHMEGQFRRGHAYLSRDSRLYFVADDPSQVDPVLEWKAGSWAAIAVPGNFKEQKDLDVFVHPRQGLWLRFAQESYCLTEDRLASCAAVPKEWSRLTRFSIDQQGQIWSFARDEVFVQKPGDLWKAIELPRPGSDNFTSSYVVDRYAHIWMIIQDQADTSERIHSIVRVAGASTQSYPELVSAVFEAGVTPNDFELDENFNAQLSNFIWSEETQAWIVHPLLEDITDHVVNTEFWNGRDKVWYTRENKTYFEHEGKLRHLPFPMSGEKPYVTRSQDIWTYGVATMNHYRWSPWTDMNAELDDIENILDIWQSRGQRHRICTHSGKVWELRDGTWSLLASLRPYDEALTIGCFEDSQSNVYMRTETAVWVVAAHDSVPQKLANRPKDESPEIIFEDSQGAVWFACLHEQGTAALCSFQNDKLTVFSLPVPAFDRYDHELCSFEIENDLYFFAGNFAAKFLQQDRVMATLPNSTLRFPNGAELSIKGCTRLGASRVLIRSGPYDDYQLFHERDNTLRVLDMLKGGFSNVIRQIRSQDGTIYLSIDEGHDASEPPVSLSEQILQGNILRIEPEGSIREVLPRALRIRAFDERTSFPTRFFMDGHGTLWSIALDYSLWTYRLIQFAESNPIVHAGVSLRPE